MNEREREFVTLLTEMSECLRPHHEWWSERFRQDSVQAQDLFNRGASVSDRYDLFRKVFSYYESGMGGLQDITPDECARAETALYESTKDLLREYWKGLGREWHEYSQFDLIPNGARVRLIPNKVIYQRPDYPATIVPDTEEVAGQIWSIVNSAGPDVTNMPSYLIRCIEGGASWRSARQEALEVIGENKSVRERLFGNRAS